MSKPVCLDINTVENCLENSDYVVLGSHLRKTFKLVKDENGTLLLFEFSEDVLNILNTILLSILGCDVNETHSDILKELFRSFRNYVVVPEVQRHLTTDDFLSTVRIAFEKCISIPDVIQMILQFLINLSVGNENGGVKVHAFFFNQIFSLLTNNVHIQEATALLYNISLFEKLNLDHNQYVCILELYRSNSDIEYLQFLAEKIVTYSSFWTHYQNFTSQNRLTILGLIRHKQIKGEVLNLPSTGLEVLTMSLINSGNVIFQTVSHTENNVEPYEVSELLQVVSSLCSSEIYLPTLQENKDLLINTGVLLINIHKLGKETKNNFSAIQSLSELRVPNDEITKHPAFGFKADLIRIIGNLCWKNKIMQDLTREAELIPVILDCCNMDARNPFIMQWVILTVRNLCENNFENQKIIRGLHQEGTVSSRVLNEMGITLDSDGNNSIKIVPLDSLRSSKD